MSHLFFCLQQSVVHVDVQHHGAVAHLFPGNGEGFLVGFGFDEVEKLATARHVAALTDVDEHSLGSVERIKSRKPRCLKRGGETASPMVCCHRHNVGNVVRSRAAAAAKDVHARVANEVFRFFRHAGRRVRIVSLFVRQSGVGMRGDKDGAVLRQTPQVRTHVGCTCGTVQTDADDLFVVTDGSQECFHRLPRKHPS